MRIGAGDRVRRMGVVLGDVRKNRKKGRRENEQYGGYAQAITNCRRPYSEMRMSFEYPSSIIEHEKPNILSQITLFYIFGFSTLYCGEFLHTLHK